METQHCSRGKSISMMEAWLNVERKSAEAKDKTGTKRGRERASLWCWPVVLSQCRLCRCEAVCK